MFPIFSVLCLLFSSNLTKIVSDDLGIDPTLHHFAGMEIGEKNRAGEPEPDGLEAKSDRWEPSYGGARLLWNGFRLRAKWREMSVSLDGREGDAERLWIDGRCRDKELLLPSDHVRWRDSRLQGDIRFLAPPGCEIVLDFQDSVAGTGVRLSMDSVSFDASGRARLGASVRLSWKSPRRWGRSVEWEWRDTVVGKVVVASGVHLPDTVRLRPDSRGLQFLSKEMVVAGGTLHAIGFRGWPGFEISEIERLEIDRNGVPVDVPAGRLQAVRVTDQHFLIWKGDVAVRRGSLLVGKARDFRLVEIVSDQGFSAGPLDRIGRKRFTSDTIEMTLVGDTLVAKRPSMRSLYHGWVLDTKLKVPLRKDGSGENSRLQGVDLKVGIAGLTDSSGRLLEFARPEEEEVPRMAPRRRLLVQLDAGIKISYRVGRSGNFREVTEARADLGEWGGAGVEVEYGFDPQATSISLDRTPIGYVVFHADHEPPVADFAFPWLERWGRFLPGKRIRQTGDNDRIVCQGRFLPNDAWRKFAGRDTLVAFATLPVIRDPKDQMKIVRSGEGVVKVVLPRAAFPQEGVQPIGVGSPLTLRLDSRGGAALGDGSNEWYVDAAQSPRSHSRGGYWKWASPVTGTDSAMHRAIYQGGSFEVDVDAKPIRWATYWRAFAGRDSITAPDGSVLRACRKIEISWEETDKGISQWTATAPSLVRRARGESKWTESKADDKIVWLEGKGFSDLFDEPSGRRQICTEKAPPLDQPADLENVSVDRAPATVGDWNSCVLAKGCSVYRSPFDSTKSDQAYLAAISTWPEVRAEGMSFAQAKSFCRSRSSRLPTQDEWENVVSTHCSPFDHPEFCEGHPQEIPQPVAQGKAYFNGIHDLGGLGAVWCADGRPCLRMAPKSFGASPSVRSKPFGPIGVQCVRDLPSATSDKRNAP